MNQYKIKLDKILNNEAEMKSLSLTQYIDMHSRVLDDYHYVIIVMNIDGVLGGVLIRAKCDTFGSYIYRIYYFPYMFIWSFYLPVMEKSS